MFTFPIAFFSSSGSTPPAEAFENYYSNEFDGVDDAIVITDSGIVSTDFQGLGNNNDYSCSAWIKTSASTGGGSYWYAPMTIIEIRTETSSGTHCPFSFGLAANKLWLGRTDDQLSGAESEVGTTTINDGNWHHVAFTVDDDAWVLYVDGSSDASGTFSTATGDCSVGTTTSNFVIGARTTNGGAISSPFEGKIDEVSVFDSALSASDVTAIYNSGAPDSLASQSNLKGWWRMGDGANYPIIKNQAHFSQTAVEFDGSDDYVDLGTNVLFDSTSAFSVSGWIKLTSYSPSYPAMILLKTDQTTGFHIGFSDVVGYQGVWFGSNTNFHRLSTLDATLASTLINGSWHHIVFTYDGVSRTTASSYTLYVDGSLKSLGLAGPFASVPNENRIGKGSNSATVFNGSIDDVSLYSTELSSSDVTDIYNSGYPKDESERSGLLSYYKFDGDTYPVVRDALQFSNASLDFDGTDDYVDLNNGASVNPSSTVSLSCWVNFDALSNYDGIFGKRVGTSVTMPFMLSLDNTSKIRFRISQSNNTAKNILTNSTVSTGTWYHVVAVADGTNVKLYLDGTLQTDTDTYDGTLYQSTADDVYIGRNSSDYLNGKVSDAIIFSSSLSASDVTGIYNSGKPKDESSLSNILGYWRMGDNTISPNVPSALGYGTHSVNFDGVDDYIDCGQVSALAGASAFTISGWFNQPTIDQARYMFGTRVSTTNQITCETWSNGFLYLEIRNGGSTYAYFDYSTVVSAGEWFHFAMVFDGSGAANADRMKAYVNGSEVTLTYIGTIPTTTNATQGDFWIGNVYGQTQRWEGPIKQMGIFDSALSASDITSIYNSGLPKDISSESGLVSYYRMGDGEDKYPNILDYKGTAHGTMTNMASDDITTANIGSGTMTNMDSTDIVADSPSGTSGQMTNMDSGDFVGAKGAGTMTNMDAEDIVADIPS